MTISKDSAVQIHYTLTNDAGDIIDSSEGRDPLNYLHGHRNIISGLESALEGKQTGDKFDVVIAPEDAYGVRDESLTQTVTRSQFNDPSEIREGASFQVQAEGQVHIATITAIDGDDITLDLNHPLADETLHFAVEVMSIREASAEEIEHGHIHGAGGHAH